MADREQDSRNYLDPKTLRRISGLELRARLLVEGFFSGMHHSPHRGLSVEFADHRAYTQGDDLRHIDWKVYGKTDKHYIKEYEQETTLELMLVVDCSESMAYKSSPELLSKHEYATALAGAIAYLALQQQDAVGLSLFDEHLSYFVKPANNAHQWRKIVQELSSRIGPRKTDMGRILSELAERLRRRTLIILISDLFDDPTQILKGLKQLRFYRHEMVVWNILDHMEITFPFDGPTMFEGLEGAGRLLTDPRAMRARYIEEIEKFQSLLRLGCGDMNVEFTVFDTSAPLDSALSAYLATRAARLRSSRVHGRG